VVVAVVVVAGTDGARPNEASGRATGRGASSSTDRPGSSSSSEQESMPSPSAICAVNASRRPFGDSERLVPRLGADGSRAHGASARVRVCASARVRVCACARVRVCACARPLLRARVRRRATRVRGLRARVARVRLDSQTNEGVARAVLGLDTLRYLCDLFALALVPVCRHVAVRGWARRLSVWGKRRVGRDTRCGARIHRPRRRCTRRITCTKTAVAVMTTRSQSAPCA